jgi:hypothetical protein
VLLLLTRGKSNREIAEALVIALSTTERHVANILAKLHVSSRTAAAYFAHRQGLMEGSLNLAVLSTSQNQLADRRLDRIFLRRRMLMPTRGLLAAPR